MGVILMIVMNAAGRMWYLMMESLVGSLGLDRQIHQALALMMTSPNQDVRPIFHPVISMILRTAFSPLCILYFLKLFISNAVGSYLLMDSTYRVEGESAQLWSPSTSASGCLQLDFHYYMYGSATNMELNVHAVTTGKSHKLLLLILPYY